MCLPTMAGVIRNARAAAVKLPRSREILQVRAGPSEAFIRALESIDGEHLTRLAPAHERPSNALRQKRSGHRREVFAICH